MAASQLPKEIEQLRAYRDRLRKAGQLLEARAVSYCMEIIRPAPGLNPAQALTSSLAPEAGNVGNNVGNAE